jgi:hypothetical protein
VSVYLERPEQVGQVIELLRASYKRARQRPLRSRNGRNRDAQADAEGAAG